MDADGHGVQRFAVRCRRVLGPSASRGGLRERYVSMDRKKLKLGQFVYLNIGGITTLGGYHKIGTVVKIEPSGWVTVECRGFQGCEIEPNGPELIRFDANGVANGVGGSWELYEEDPAWNNVVRPEDIPLWNTKFPR